METDTVRLVGLLILMAVAVLADVRTRKVPNRLIVIGASFGIACASVPGGIGFVQSVGGLGLGLAMLLPLYALRATGAGDVKLMASAGSFLGIEATFVATLFTFAFGGVLALLYSSRAGTLTETLRNMKMVIFQSIVQVSARSLPNAHDLPISQARMPYSLAIAGGVTIYLARRFYSTGAFT